MYSDGPNRYWGATASGLLVRWDGSKPEQWHVPAGLFPSSIWGTKKEAWIATSDGDGLRFRDGRWSTIPIGAGLPAGVSGFAGHGAWFTAADKLTHVNEAGAIDKVVPCRFVAQHATWVAAPNDVWDVEDEETAAGFRLHVLRYDGKTWHDMHVPAKLAQSEPLPLLTGTSETDVWAVIRGVPYHWNGSRWTRRPGPTDSMWISMSSPDDVLVGGPSAFWRWDGEKWHLTPTADDDIIAETMIGSGVVATDEYVMIDKGGHRNPIPGVGSGILARYLWVGTDAIWEVGQSKRHPDEIAVARFDGTRWSLEELGRGHAAAVDGRDHLFVLDDAGGVWRRDKIRWKREASGLGPFDTFNSPRFAVVDDDDIWVATGGHVAHRAVGKWTVLAPLKDEKVLALKAHAGHIFAALLHHTSHGDRAWLARFEGNAIVKIGRADPDTDRIVVRNARDIDMLTATSHVRWQAHDTLSETNYDGELMGLAITQDATVVSGRQRWHSEQGLWIEHGQTKDWIDLHSDSEFRIAARDDVIWMMETESGDLLTLRDPLHPAVGSRR